jgi:hypothetical protein
VLGKIIFIDIHIKYINIGYMEKELELKLVEKYPKILRDYGGDMRQTCLAFGIEINSGWFNLLDNCMNKLQYFCDLCSKDDREVQVVANQVKEKYGTLRFYYTSYGANDTESRIIDNIVSAAEMASERTCEVTGKDGTLCVRYGWYRTLCYEEARKEGYTACDEGTEEWWQIKDKKNENKQTNENKS